MRRLADRLVNWLLSRAPWYQPDEIEAREARTERVHQRSIAVRVRAEKVRAEMDGAVAVFRR
jgi:hypothetical protein